MIDVRRDGRPASSSTPDVQAQEDELEKALPSIVAAAGEQARANAAISAAMFEARLREEVERAARERPWKILRPNSM
jgi:hypothetical protein